MLEFLFNGDSYPEDSENAIEKTQLRHFQRSPRCSDCASGAMHGGQVSSVAEVVDPVVATRSHREQGSGVSVVSACGSVHCSSVPSVEASVPFSSPSGILKVVYGAGLLEAVILIAMTDSLRDALTSSV